MLSYLFRSSPAYPQKQCYFCQTTSVILPPYVADPSSSASPSNPSASTRPLHPSNSASDAASSSALAISTGTADNWYCSSCQCCNTFNPDGSFKDQWSRPMWDEQWNDDRNRLLQHQLSRRDTLRKQLQNKQRDAAAAVQTSIWGQHAVAPNRDSEYRMFCHTCQTNQTLQINLLADYLPEESDPEYADKLRALPGYRASIAARYPSVCDDCAPAVHDKIQERDQMARSWTLAQWLAQKPSVDSYVPSSQALQGLDSPKRPTVEPSSKNGDAAPSSTRRFRRKAAILWLYQGACWLVSTIAVVTLYALASIRPSQVRDTLMTANHLFHDEEPLSMPNAIAVSSIALVLVALLQGSRWNPTARRVARARSRGLRPEVTGLEQWQTFQRVLATLRALAVLAMVARTAAKGMGAVDVAPLSADLDRIIRSFGIAGVLTEILLTFLSVRRLSVRMPPTMRLVSKPLYASPPHALSIQGRPANGHVEAAVDPFSSLSLAEQRRAQAHHPGTLPLQRSVRQHGTDMDGPAAGGLESLLAPPDRSAPSCTPSFPVQPHRDTDGDEIMRFDPPPATDLDPDPDPSADEDEPTTTPGDTGTGSAWSRARWSGDGAGAAATRTRKTEAYDFRLGPQRFWEPQRATGLEEVFGTAVRLDEGERREERGKERERERGWRKVLGVW